MLGTIESLNDKLERILLKVQKPGRYVGGELNQVIKNVEKVKTRVCLVFPDIYDIGLSNLGLTILYDVLNKRDDVWAERAYSPWIDMESLMRESNIPLYSLESKTPLSQFDIIGISIPYETLYSNVLNLLDLAHIPLFSSERRENDPLILAGGHAMYNPEPMSTFLDAVLIGEGDDAISEIVDSYQAWKEQGLARSELLENLSSLQGMYIPSLYDVAYNEDHTINNIYPMKSGIPETVQKVISPRLPPPPTKLIVPSIDVVHNRVPVEIMRGCTRGCRFCHAGMINRPVRERPVNEIVQAIKDSVLETGYEEVSLLSLSSSDYSQITELVEQINANFSDQGLKVSLPSLRIESLSVDILEKLKNQRQNNFTLAPEAASDRVRNIINKPISTEQVMETVGTIFYRGWTNIKLYFMIGHPGEAIEDVKAIISMSQAVLLEGRRTIGNRARLNIGIGTFVPKAHTPFQWASLDTEENIQEKQSILKKEFRKSGIKFSWTDYENSMYEAVFSRGDRRLANVIFTAWSNGARFDAWEDQFKHETWKDAFKKNQIDPSFFTHRLRKMDEVFPWEHINILVKKSFLKEEYLMSLKGETRSDCRTNCYSCGVLPEILELRKQNPGAGWKCPEIESGNKIREISG